MRQVDYKYCPLCATPLVERTIYRQQRLACPSCHFVYFTDPKVAVIALVTHENRILLARRAVNPAKGQWALQGGYMDAGEMPESALQRELHEELSLDVRIVQLLDVFPMAVLPGRNQGIVLAYHATPADVQRIEFVCDDDVCEAGWFEADQLPAELAFDSTLVLL
ncbi:MAG: NUDIX domain-containing protein, partial [Chloroflexi bacterium]|nr:NUDIX domain-containing protein [Chloroflexota bacterium]